MPISPTPSIGTAVYQVWVTGPNDVEFRVEVASQIHTEANADAAIQSLVNHLAEWPDLVSIGQAGKVVPNRYVITVDGSLPVGPGGAGGRPDHTHVKNRS